MLCVSILLKTEEFGDKFSIKFYCYYIKYLQARDYVSEEPIGAIFYELKILPLCVIHLLAWTKT